MPHTGEGRRCRSPMGGPGLREQPPFTSSGVSATVGPASHPVPFQRSPHGQPKPSPFHLPPEGGQSWGWLSKPLSMVPPTCTAQHLQEADEDTEVQSSSEAGHDLNLPLSRSVYTTEPSSPSYLRVGKKDRGAVCRAPTTSLALT